jgi:hypothetical protein
MPLLQGNRLDQTRTIVLDVTDARSPASKPCRRNRKGREAPSDAGGRLAPHRATAATRPTSGCAAGRTFVRHPGDDRKAADAFASLRQDLHLGKSRWSAIAVGCQFRQQVRQAIGRFIAQPANRLGNIQPGWNPRRRHPSDQDRHPCIHRRYQA